MARVFTNLINNAIRATPENETISIDAVYDDVGVTVRVRDTGQGLSPDQMQRAFDPAFSTKGNGVGGLGLAITYLLVEAHGGHLDLRPNDDRGLTAAVWLPLAFEHASDVGDGGLLVALEDTRFRELAGPLVHDWEQAGGVAAETRSRSETDAILLDEPDAWDLAITDRESISEALPRECTVLVLDPLSTLPKVRRCGSRKSDNCAALERWVHSLVIDYSPAALPPTPEERETAP